ncbi:hypothetical protein CPB84DRAFT_1861255 [Gymnopilus junonius]|uniref:NADH:flavin oxidoreductase/NADH oxidase N-terminal domain-containing protein n=1 Tax=Gymnopilus junonius TaxID=109634 RepID=A0A9P5NZR1_GYMJU|nr:hypothetical protein CPB84DRAFT_1861255 [Gymnopilus junonius]
MSIDEDSAFSSRIFQSITLPCGIIVQNRLVKVAMYEHLASFYGGLPNDYHLRLYSEWAKHGWGMVVTGNVQVAKDHLTLGRDLVLPESLDSEELSEPFRKLAAVIHGVYQPSIGSAGTLAHNKTLAIMQLNHPGRQSSNFIGGRLPFHAPLAPSSVPLVHGKKAGLTSSLLNLAMFQTPRAMTKADILAIIGRFVDGAVLAFRTGFDGIQLHAAHGYLLAQFLSDKTNRRQDDYSSENALNIIRVIVKRIRMSTPKNFAICIKMSAGDYKPEEHSLGEAGGRALEHLLGMASWGLIDVIEISGGDYEKPDFMLSSSKSSRQAFFARFSHQALKSLNSLRSSSTRPLPLILLTGGLRTPALLCSALASNDANLLGIGRGSVVCPALPSVIRTRLRDLQRWGDVPFQAEPILQNGWILEYPPFLWVLGLVPKIQLIGAGINMAWYIVAMRRIACDTVAPGCLRPPYEIGGLQSVFWMWVWMSRSRNGNSKLKLLALCIRVFSLLFVSTLIAYLLAY